MPPKYDTVMERCRPSSPELDRLLISFVCQNGIPGDPLKDLLQEKPDQIRLARIREVIETALSGRKYEVLLLRSQGKSMAEIAMMLSISKNTVQKHYRLAIQQVRQALGLELEKTPRNTPAKTLTPA